MILLRSFNLLIFLLALLTLLTLRSLFYLSILNILLSINNHGRHSPLILIKDIFTASIMFFSNRFKNGIIYIFNFQILKSWNFANLCLQMILRFIMFDLNNLIPSTSLFLKKSKLILLLPNKLILCLNLLIHLMFKFIQMWYLFHINFVLLRKLFINGCLAILYDN